MGVCLTAIGDAGLYILPGVINFYACWYFVSLMHDLTDVFGKAGAILLTFVDDVRNFNDVRRFEL